MASLTALRAKSKRAYPKQIVKTSKAYKVEGYEGYLLLDECENNRVPHIFYRGKWREDSISVSNEAA